MSEAKVLEPQGRFIDDTPAERASMLCRACGSTKDRGLWVCWDCMRVLKGGAAHDEAIMAANFPWYTLPEPWTWEAVAIVRNNHRTPERMFPVACAPGVTAWGVPINPAALAAHTANRARSL